MGCCGELQTICRVSVVKLGQVSKICGIAGLWAALTCTAIGSSVSHGEE